MLLEFTCSNHKSIRDKIVFSALATSDTVHEDKLYTFGKTKVLKSAVIYGANGSGKSNFIDAISFVRNLIIKSINYQLGQGIRQIPHKLATFGTDSSYGIQFVAHGIRYAYGFTLRNCLVTEEYLYYFPKGKQAKIFERNGEEIQAGSKFRGKFKTCLEALKPNKLMFSCAATFSAVSEIETAYRFFSDDLVIYGPNPGAYPYALANPNVYGDRWLNYSLHQIANSPKEKNAVLAFMQSLGINAKDLIITIKRKKLDVADIHPLPAFLSDEVKTKIIGSDVDVVTAAKIVYSKFESDIFKEESTGIKKLIAILSPIINIITCGKVLVCDELEANLHESLVYGLVREFIRHDGGEDKAPQIFFTTHATGLLDLNLFRRDQIWFTELKEPDRETDLYSLAEIKNVRKDENFGRGYISGKYGAIPMLNAEFEKNFENN